VRKILEKEAIKQYSIIPDLSHLGFDIIVFTFFRSEELVHPFGIRERVGSRTAKCGVCKHRPRFRCRRNSGFSA
jgi:hypothetical protein